MKIDSQTLKAKIVGTLDVEDKRRYELFCVPYPEEKRDYFYHLEFLGDESNKKSYNKKSEIWHEFLREGIIEYRYIKGKFPDEYNISIEVSD